MLNHVKRAISAIALQIMLALAVPLLFSGLAWSQEYSVKDLGNLGYGSSTPTGVNNSGQVVGYYLAYPATWNDDGFWTISPFIYSNGVMNPILYSDEGYMSYALAINNDGIVVGGYNSDSTWLTNAFLWNGGFQSLAPAVDSFVAAINQDGVAVGVDGYLQAPEDVNWVSVGGVPIGAIFENGAVTDIPKGPYLAVGPSGINNSRQISGLCFNQQAVPLGCILTNGVPKLIKPVKAFSGDVLAYPAAINALGYMCGDSYLTGTYSSLGNDVSPTASAATYWMSSTGFLLGHPANTKDTWCAGMDDYGNGVGGAATKTGGDIGVLYDPVNGARNLNKLIPQFAIKGHTFVITNAVSISDTGFIAAQCSYENGNDDACLLTPNPVLILRDTILDLASNPNIKCVSCLAELEHDGRSLPTSLEGLTAKEKEGVLTTVEQIGAQIESLESHGKISEPDALLLTHDAELVAFAIQPPR
jgi:probable HAF family extracellular repeat protein